MQYLTREIGEYCKDLNAEYTLSSFEALQIAVHIQRNRILSQAFLVNSKGPSALESIAMELGASIDNNTIKDALYKMVKE